MIDFAPPEPDLDFSSTVSAIPQIPHHREAEEATIGAVLINPFSYWEIEKIIKARDFYIHRNRFIWEAFEGLVQKTSPIDLLTVSDELAGNGKLDQIGGSAYLTSLINQVPSSLNATAYAAIVKGCSERRDGINFANEIAKAAYDDSNQFSLRDQAIRIVKTEGGRSNRVSAKEAGSRAIDTMISNPRFCKFGIPNQDVKIGGLFGDELSIIAGYQGTGKTALKIHSMRKNADIGKIVMDCSLEMSADQLWTRMACGDMEIDMNQLRSGRVSAQIKSEIAQYTAAMSEKYEGKIIIYESPMTPVDVLSATMMEQPDIVYIDHLDLLEGKPPRDSKMDWYNFCTRFLRQNVAKGENHIPVVLLHQLSRGASREKRRPTKHDLAYAGENDSDAIFLLHRPDEEIISKVVDLEIITAKSRFGWTGTETVRFHLTKQQFFAPAGYREEPEPDKYFDGSD